MPRRRRRRRSTWSLARAGYLVFKTDHRCLTLTLFFAKHCDTIPLPLFVSKGLPCSIIIQGDEVIWTSYPAPCGGCRCLRWVSHTEGCVWHRSIHACTKANGDQVPSSSRTSGRTSLSPSLRLLTCIALIGPWRIMSPNTPDRLNFFQNASSTTTARSSQTTRKISRLDSVGVCAWADTLQTRPCGPRSRPSWRCLRCRHRGTRTGARCRWCPSLRAELWCRSTFYVCETRGLMGLRSGDVGVHSRSRVVSCRERRGWTRRCSNG
jgi:hypothetical protein